MMGPELRQYMFDADDEGRPFSRVDFSNIVVQGKYCLLYTSDAADDMHV